MNRLFNHLLEPRLPGTVGGEYLIIFWYKKGSLGAVGMCRAFGDRPNHFVPVMPIASKKKSNKHELEFILRSKVSQPRAVTTGKFGAQITSYFSKYAGKVFSSFDVLVQPKLWPRHSSICILQLGHKVDKLWVECSLISII